MFVIKEKNNIILDESAIAKKEGRKLYIYGAADGGKVVYENLCGNNIMPDGFCVDKEYYEIGSCFCGLPVVPIDSLWENAQKDDLYLVITACMGKRYCDRGNVKFINADFTTFWFQEKMDYSFVNKHKEVLEKLYEGLGDEKSQECMEAYLNQKISGKFEYLEQVKTEQQYYEKDLINLKNVSCMVDCGAYDGDTFYAFCKKYEEETGKTYTGKAFLLEADEITYQRLLENCNEKDNAIPMRVGVWNKKTNLKLKRAENNMPKENKISEEGDISIAVDKIDNLISAENEVGFIKMDIEGSELNALKGAERIIRKYKPILAICVYHKKEDLLTIPQYIKSLYSGYRLFLRVYDVYCRELVLYALPY